MDPAPVAPVKSFEKRNPKIWFAFCGSVALFWLAVPFLWRTEFSTFLMVSFCLWPFLLAGGLAALIVCAMRYPTRASQVVAGSLLILAGFGFAIKGDPIARRMIFSLNYPFYRSFAESTLHRSPKGKTERLIDKPGLGGYGSTYAIEDRKPRIYIETISGPSLEIVLFSPIDLSNVKEEATYKLVRRDELGFWYFVIEP